MRLEARFAAVGVLAVLGMRAGAEEDAAGAAVDPAGLVRAVIAQEDKVHGIQSLLLRIDGKWTRTPKDIEANRADLEKRFPGFKLTAERFPELRPEMKETLELAFDQSRLRNFHVERDTGATLQ